MRGVTYAAVEIIVLVVLAAIIGFLIGWILRRFLYDIDLGTYEARLAAAEQQRRVAEAEAEKVNESLESVRAELREAEAKSSEASERVASLTADLVAANESLESVRVELREAEVKGSEASQRVASLTADLDTVLQDAQAKEAAIGRLEAELAGAGALQEQADVRAARIAELEVLVVEKESGDATRVASLEEALRAARDEHVGCAARLAERDARIAELEEVVATAAPVASGAPVAPAGGSKDHAIAAMAEIAARTAGGGPAVDDDLKKIHGVGPKLERLLKSMGITSFAQIARFEAGDVATVTAALDAFPGRIERDDWMSSAAEEHEKKYGAPVSRSE